jgi:hypothetical protein
MIFYHEGILFWPVKTAETNRSLADPNPTSPAIHHGIIVHRLCSRYFQNQWKIEFSEYFDKRYYSLRPLNILSWPASNPEADRVQTNISGPNPAKRSVPGRIWIRNSYVSGNY